MAACTLTAKIEWAWWWPVYWNTIRTLAYLVRPGSEHGSRRLLDEKGDTDHAGERKMNKIQHPSNNAVLGAPKGWDLGGLPCGALPITLTKVGDQPAVVSYRRPTAEELAALNAGGSVALWVLGNTMPPVALEVESPQ